MRAVRKCSKSSDGWNSGDKDTLAVLFQYALVWDGSIPSKESRDYLIENGYAFRFDGLTALTGKGKLAALICWPMPAYWLAVRRRWPKQPLFHRIDQKRVLP